MLKYKGVVNTVRLAAAGADFDVVREASLQNKTMSAFI